MKWRRHFFERAGLIVMSAAGLMVSSCSSTAPVKTAASSAQAGTKAKEASGEQGGAQLWAARCTQCHFARDPGYFTDAQWEVIMLHMRVRANLTAQKHRAIVEFLKSAN